MTAIDAAPGLAASATPTCVVNLCLVSHTNAGKTTLTRTLLGRDIGEVRDRPHVTEVAESHALLQTPQGDVLQLTDTPGFGDSLRLARRLRLADNPIGWLLRELWDRYRDRPLWSSQQALRAARDSADVLLYLANAAEDPRDATYVVAEMEILRWIGKPVLLLLNQLGPPKPSVEEESELERWRSHLAPLGLVRAVLPLDAFARCWVQEAVLLDAVEKVLPEDKRAPFARLVSQWKTDNIGTFQAAMSVLAAQLAAAARARAPVQESAPAGRKERLLRAIGLDRKAEDAARNAAVDALGRRMEQDTRQATQELIALHRLDGDATGIVLERMREHFASRIPLDERRAAAWGGIVSGALGGLAGDLAAGGLTLGAGMIAGGLLGAFGGAGLARGYNLVRGADHASVGWGPPALDALTAAAILRYLAVAHFGRGRGRYVEGEAPAFWQEEVAKTIAEHREVLHALWESAAHNEDESALPQHLATVLAETAAQVLDRLYPHCVPQHMLASEWPRAV
jgi:hypothetical protein